MPQMTLDYDEQTEALLEDLKKFFGVNTKAAVLRRALAIARAAKEFSDDDKSIRFTKPNSKKSKTFVIGG